MKECPSRSSNCLRSAWGTSGESNSSLMNCCARHMCGSECSSSCEKSVSGPLRAGSARTRPRQMRASPSRQRGRTIAAGCPGSRARGASRMRLMPQLEHQQDPQTVAVEVGPTFTVPGEELLDEPTVQVRAGPGRRTEEGVLGQLSQRCALQPSTHRHTKTMLLLGERCSREKPFESLLEDVATAKAPDLQLGRDCPAVLDDASIQHRVAYANAGQLTHAGDFAQIVVRGCDLQIEIEQAVEHARRVDSAIVLGRQRQRRLRTDG